MLYNYTFTLHKIASLSFSKFQDFLGIYHANKNILGADLHMAQLMPLPLTISCSSKSRLNFNPIFQDIILIFNWTAYKIVILENRDNTTLGQIGWSGQKYQVKTWVHIKVQLLLSHYNYQNVALCSICMSSLTCWFHCCVMLIKCWYSFLHFLCLCLVCCMEVRPGL